MKPLEALMPKDAPEFLREAIDKARRAGQPIVIDFWAEWCAPCLQLKKVTFHEPKVAKLLEEVQMVFVDLDKYPALGKAFGVESVPDVFLIDRKGMIVDRLHNFEPPADFLVRLKKLFQADGGGEPERMGELLQEKKKTDTAADASSITSLGESLDALRNRFNSHKGRYRFVALLSPT